SVQASVAGLLPVARVDGCPTLPPFPAAIYRPVHVRRLMVGFIDVVTASSLSDFHFDFAAPLICGSVGFDLWFVNLALFPGSISSLLRFAGHIAYG
ncbi:hypothetical protein A2U01_0041018, partial [Trifolium medium]|nr:hypothetical protein [Trifolium medium]